MEVVNGDALVVKAPDAGFQKIFLSSLRSPKLVLSFVSLLTECKATCTYVRTYIYACMYRCCVHTYIHVYAYIYISVHLCSSDIFTIEYVVCVFVCSLCKVMCAY